MASLTHGHEFEQALGEVKDREAWCPAVHEVAELNMIELLNGTELKKMGKNF